MDFLNTLDLTVFHWVNHTATTPALDLFFAFITNLHREVWFSWGVIPLFIAVAIWRKGFGVWRAVLVILVAIGFCDLVNHRVLKPAVGRERPFRVESVQAQLRVEPGPRGFSFPSNHAVNTMAAAVLIGMYFPTLKVIALILVFLVGYSRPYLGVHYPSDILFGWILGAFIAWCVVQAVRRWWPAGAPPIACERK